MKYYIYVLAFLFLSSCAFTQPKLVNFSGKLNKKDLSVIHIRNIDGLKIDVPVNEDGSFSIKIDDLSKGFYEVDEIGTVYFNSGYELNIQASENGEYIFSGRGGIENNALREAIKQLPDFIPVDENMKCTQDAYYMNVTDFLEKIDAFQKNGEKIFNKSNDEFFREQASLDLKFYGKNLLMIYSVYYGKNLKKLAEFHAMMEKLDQNAADYAKQRTSAYAATSVKTFTIEEKKKLDDSIYLGWDKNDEILFRNSSAYRQVISSYISFLSINKYKTPPQKQDNTSKKIKSPIIAEKGEISNPYILEYFEYSFVTNILKRSKDTAILNQYYKEYSTKLTRPDYKKALEDIYHNAVTFVDNAHAPEFSYKDINGKTVSLKSLRGKFVYIDVWATWCSPCKAEIPHLKKVEDDYHDKNIAFVSISVDKQKDWDKWEQYVKEHNMKGIQLVADKAAESDFIKKMNINSIPRFILIDPSGKIISANALRPSNQELRDLLNKLL